MITTGVWRGPHLRAGSEGHSAGRSLLGDNELVGWGGREKRFGPVGIVGNVLLRFTHRLSSEGREWAKEKREWDRDFDGPRRVHLMEHLSFAVEVAMDQLRSGGDVDEVRAGVIATLSPNFGLEQRRP